MKFGRLDVSAGQGAILAHAIKRSGLALKKGEVLGDAQLAALAAAGVGSLIAARMEPGDVHEDEAARQIAGKLAGINVRIDPPFTGRCNLFAACDGLLMAGHEGIDRLNAIDEAVTLATALPFQPVTHGEMIATVKIIPFAVPEDVFTRAMEAARPGLLAIAPYRPLQVAAISTILPGLKASVVAKTLRVLDQRLTPARAPIVRDMRVPHEVTALAEAIRVAADHAGLVVIFGASAITDRRDVIPAAIVEAGGQVEHLGMPVDPGNLLLLGAIGDIPVIGAPGCARSPRENGFDFVLQRILAGIRVTGADLRAMGTGGLLTEIATRPHPRNPGRADD